MLMVAVRPNFASARPGVAAARAGGVDVDVGGLADGAGADVGGLADEARADLVLHGQVERLDVAALEDRRERLRADRGRQLR